MEIITSVKNQKIKYILSLQESSARRRENKFIIEGYREIKLAVSSGYVIHTLVLCSEILEKIKREEIILECKQDPEIIEINKYVFEKLAYRDNNDGLIAIAETKTINLEQIILCKSPLIIVLESVEKPGNLGAILRTADAANVDAVIVCDTKTDIYNPNIIRSSLGCVFTKQIVCCTADQALTWLKAKNIKIKSAAISDKAINCYSSNFKESCAIAMGSEAFGLNEHWLKNSDEIIMIPMNGKIDSMNVSVSCAILVFEAVRQRNYA